MPKGICVDLLPRGALPQQAGLTTVWNDVGTADPLLDTLMDSEGLEDPPGLFFTVL